MQAEHMSGAVASGTRRDSRKLVKTNTPGIYRRRSADGSLGQYVVVYRAGGKQRREYAATLEAARRIKRARESDRDRGEWQERTTVTLRTFLDEWLPRYHGTGRRGFRESTRVEYRRLLDVYARRFFSERLRLVDVTPRQMAEFVAWLADERRQGKRLSDSSIANAVIPVRAALASAKREGLIRHNPADGLALPHREEVEHDDHEEVGALSREQLAALLAMAPAGHRLLLKLMVSTGLRVSEAIALQRRHLHLDGGRPHVRVRHALVRGSYVPPKTKHGRRNVPLSASLVSELRSHLRGPDDAPDALVFRSQRGTALDPDNLRARMLKPLMGEIGAPWAAWHTLRHSYTSLQIASGANIVQLSRALGHHSPAFTLSVYAHLLEGEEVAPLDLMAALQATAARVDESSQLSEGPVVPV